MAEEIRLGWIKSPDEIKFAPKTFAEQVIVNGETTLDMELEKYETIKNNCPILDAEDTEGTCTAEDYVSRIQELEAKNLELTNELAELNSNNTWIKLADRSALLLKTGTTIDLAHDLSNFTEIRFMYRYSDTGYCYEKTFKLGIPTNNFTLDEFITNFGKVYSIISGASSGQTLTVAANGSTNGVYLMQIWARKTKFAV